MRRDCSVETSNPNDERPRAKARSGNNTIESGKNVSISKEEEEEIAKKKCNQESETAK
jgi:hypothetical protein